MAQGCTQVTCRAGRNFGNCIMWIAIALAVVTLQAKGPNGEQGGSIPWVEITQCLQRGGLIRSRLFTERPSIIDDLVGCGLHPFCSKSRGCKHVIAGSMRAAFELRK